MTENAHPVATASDAPRAVPTGEYLPWDDDSFLLDPYPWFARVQQEAPIFLDPTGVFVVTRYDDIMEFGQHPAMSVEPGWDQAGPWAVARETIIGRDEPDHSRLRRQTTKWFAPKLVREWITTTASVTADLLDNWQQPTIDGWHQLSVIPTHRTMCRVLQVPDVDIDPVRAAMERTMPMLRMRTRPGEIDMASEAFDYLVDRVDKYIEAKQAEPGDGLADALISAADDGVISSEEARATLVMFYGLGHMDVGYTIASGLHALAQRPDVYAAFRDTPEARDKIVNEIIRLDAPELSFYRTATEEVTIRGIRIPAGSSVRFMVAAANIDPDVFEDPLAFDFARPSDQSRILSFGLGPHTCAGQGIARAETRTVLEVVAERYSRIELAGEPVMDNTDFSRHYKSLPLRLIP